MSTQDIQIVICVEV